MFIFYVGFILFTNNMFKFLFNQSLQNADDMSCIKKRIGIPLVDQE